MCAAIGLVLITLAVNAQPKDQSEREEMYRRYLDFPKYVKGGAIEPNWMSDGNSFWYAEGAPENTVIWKVDPVTNTRKPMFDTDRLRQSMAKVLGHEPACSGVPFDSFEYLERGETVRFEVEDRHFVLRLEDYELREVEPPSAEELELKTPRTWHGRYGWLNPSETLSPDGRWFAGIENRNLYFRSTSDGRKVAVTNDGEPDHEWQLRDAWLGDSGLWSPDGRYLPCGKMDYRNAPAIPIVHYLEDIERVEWVNYSKSGQDWPRSELYVFDSSSLEKTKVNVDHEIGSLDVLAWKRDSSELYLSAGSPPNTDFQILGVNPRNGAARVILRSKEWGDFTLLADSDRFLWMSTHDLPGTDLNRLFLCALDGRLLGRVSTSDVPVERLVLVDEVSEWVYYLARGDKERPFDEHLYRVKIEGGEPEQLTQATGVHSIQFSPSKQFFLATHSSIERPPRVELRKADGKRIRTLCEVDVSALSELDWTPGEEFVVKDSKGENEIRGVLYKPADFDPARKYPLIQWTYPGTRRILFQRTFVPSWHGSLKAQAFAQLGFVTFVIRKSYDHASPRELWDRFFPRSATADSVAVIRQLAAQNSFIDLDRVGIYGSSKGGFYSIRAILEAPEIYDVAVSVAGVTDLAAHMGNLPYLGPPDSEAFKRSSVFHLADKLDGKLLLIHGTGDKAVPISHMIRMADALIRANKHFDMLIMPEETHMTLNIFDGYGLDAARRYFVEQLKP